MENVVKSGIFGVCVGDALGVPVEFKKREDLRKSPVTGMKAFGTHNQPAGTWSDDSSLTLCLAEVLVKGYNLEKIGQGFVRWYEHGHWTPHGRVFDVGIATRQAIHKIGRGNVLQLCGGSSEKDNGNGSLMRILPLLFYIKGFSLEQRFEIIKEVSSITHAHIRSVISCFIYLEFLLEILHRKNKLEAYQNMCIVVNQFLDNNPICSQAEMNLFERILNNNISKCAEDEIKSGGYVLHSLEASLWCFMNSESYSEAVLKAVNLGEDTDTTGAITGGIAGIYYGFENIPEDWISELVRKEDIEKICEKLETKYFSK
ncbi:ADP-ribosylglycohydrolase family protein [Chryseobacterium proteolyticum]|uniref:ADP-ribosylglycohydrolase family protein n=1 Tax=Chryseobacterium proteolyticum TaxID=118127 RepID=UPI00398338FF